MSKLVSIGLCNSGSFCGQNEVLWILQLQLPYTVHLHQLGGDVLSVLGNYSNRFLAYITFVVIF